MRRSSPLALLLALGLRSVLWGQPPETLVFITETGSKYHLDGCLYLERSRIPIPLSEAASLGFQPCGRCRPPAPPPSADGEATGERDPNGRAAAAPYRLNAAGVPRSGAADLRRMTPAVVVRHIDGDTVRVSIPRPPEGIERHESVRLLGVDTPELLHPNPVVADQARAASEFTRSLLLYRIVYLAFDWNLRDRYGRLLAYLYLADGHCHNAELLREGYAHAYTQEPIQFLEEFRALEREARRFGRGLWGSS